MGATERAREMGLQNQLSDTKRDDGKNVRGLWRHPAAGTVKLVISSWGFRSNELLACYQIWIKIILN